MKYFFFISLFILHSLWGQKADLYIEKAKKAYPDFDRSIEYLKKASFADFDNLELKFLLIKLKLASANSIYFREIFSDSWKFRSENPYTYAWMQISRKLLDKTPDLSFTPRESQWNGPVDKAMLFSKGSEDILNLYVRYKLLRHFEIKDEHKDRIIELANQEKKSFNTLITALSLADKKLLYKKHYEPLLKSFINLTKEQIDEGIQSLDPFQAKSVPQILDSVDGHKLLKSITFAYPYKHYLISKLYEYEEERLRLAKGYIEESVISNYSLPVYGNTLEAFLNTGQYEKVIRHISKVDYRNDQEFLKAHIAGGKAYLKIGLPKTAAKYFAKAANSQKSSVLESAYFTIKAFIQAGDHNRAKAFLTGFKHKEIPEEVTSKILKAYYKAQLHDYVDLVNLYANLKNTSLKESPSLIQELGNASIYIANIPDQIKIPQQVKSIEFYKLANLTQSLLHYKNERFEDSTKLLSSMKTNLIGNFDLELLEARLDFKNKNTKSAKSKIEKLLKVSPSHFEAIKLKGMILLEENDYKGAYNTFNLLSNKKAASYYKLIPLAAMGKFDLVEKTCAQLVKGNNDYRTAILYHMISEKNDKEKADKFLKEQVNQFNKMPEVFYIQYKLGKISLDEYKKKQDFGPLFGLKFNIAIGFEAMHKGEKERALEHFKKCLIPYSIDQPEYHMAKACIKMLEK